LVKLHF